MCHVHSNHEMLQCVAVCCSVLQCVAAWSDMLHSVAECRNILHCVAMCCRSLLQCVVGLFCSIFSSDSQENSLHIFERAPHNLGKCLLYSEKGQYVIEIDNTI